MNNNNAIIILIAVVIILLSVSIVMFGACKGIGDSALPAIPEDVTVPMSKTDIDYSVLNQELVDAVNAAWMKRTGESEPMIDSLDELLTLLGFYYEYLGEYNGYKIFTHSKMTIAPSSGVVNVANHEFFGSWQFEILGYKDGTLHSIEDLYESGELSYLDISVMHDRYYELWHYYVKYDYVKDKIITIPGVIPLKFDSDTEARAKEKIKSAHLFEYSWAATADNVYILDYYGEYNGISFFTYKSPLKEYNADTRYEDVGGQRFIYLNGNRIYGYDGKSLYTLTSAYAEGLITDANIASIKKYYTAYNPFVVDEYCMDYSGIPIDY